MGSIIDREKLKVLIQNLRKDNKVIATTNGSFDLFHAGHLDTLKYAKSKGDVLIVGLNSDSSIRKYKSDKRPIIPQEERAYIISSVNYVDYVVIFDEETPIKLLEIIKPNYHVKGSEYKENLIEKDVVEKNGGRIVFIDRVKDISTTKIINRIIKNYGGSS